jgi:predicted amidophosphoribosyltransferase
MICLLCNAISKNPLCKSCLKTTSRLPFNVQRVGEIPVYSLIPYLGVYADFIKLFKGGTHKKKLQWIFKKLLTQKISRWNCEYVFPIPGSHDFDHAYTLAEVVANLCDANLLYDPKIKPKKIELKKYSFTERHETVVEKFGGVAIPKADVVILIDDVITTGATMSHVRTVAPLGIA